MRMFPFLAAGAVMLVLAGRATQRPVFYPNEKLKQASAKAAQRDVDECIRLAEQSGVTL